MASEIQPTLRQVSPLPWEVELQQVQSAADRREWLREWNVQVPPSTKSLNYSQAFTTAERVTPAEEESLGSIYIPRTTPRGFPSSFRRSARIFRKSNLSVSQSPSRTNFRTPLGTFHPLSYTPTQQEAEVILRCPEIDAVYCISRDDWKLERRRRRIFERDFRRYNRSLRYRECEGFGPTDWEQVIVSQKDYEPSDRQDKSPTPGFTTEESDLEPCSDTELFGYTVKPPRRNQRNPPS